MTTPPEERRLLLVGGGGDMTLSVDVAVAALRQAAARGLTTHVTNLEETLAATPAVSAAADAASAVDHTDPGAVAKWAAGQGFDVVFGVREMAQVAVAETATSLGLPGNDPDAVRRIRTKDSCREALTAAGFRQPRVRVCRSLADAEEFAASVPGPWVVKPRDGSSSEGVKLASGGAELAEAVAALPNPDEFLVEEFVTGAEFSVEGVFLGGEPHVFAVTAKEKLPPPYFVEIGHVLPSGLPRADGERIEATVVAALKALGLTHGLFHVELWLNSGGVVLGEVHARIGGGWIHKMLEHTIPGIELYGLAYDDALDAGDPPKFFNTTGAAASRYFVPPAGRITAISGWDAVKAHPAVLYAELAVGEGDVVRPFSSGEDRVGAVVVGAETPGAARRLAAELVESVEFEVEPA
ncbi:ATP-grasp domain-containing protein [Lentzea sp. CA-135723]|uniref:ATP-grasp domain-containing protein n=1 Tax=Lentzea sp. CA-135723 TaxID=3239950 RepID=UPI003D8D6E8A